jgi:hypothetical protein
MPGESASRFDWALFAMAAVVLAVYVKTASPSIAGGDSGEIVAEGCHGGIVHPPGYPLITMIMYLISHSFESVGSVAFRVNCFCSLCTAVAVLFMGKIVLHYSSYSKGAVGAVGAALFAMGLFSFSPLIWTYATTSEVFPLNTLFASAITYLVVQFSSTGSLPTAYLGALLCGLAICNQHTILLLEFPLILWMLFLLRRQIAQRPSVLAKLAGSFLVGLLPYLYMPLAASLHPRAGSWGDAASLSGFLHHFLRRDYGTFQLFSGAQGKSAEGFWERNEAYLRDLWVTQGGPPQGLVLLLAALGALDMLSRALPSLKASSSSSASASRSRKKGGKGKGAPSDEQQTQTKTAEEAEAMGAMGVMGVMGVAQEQRERWGFEASCTPAVLVGVLFFYFGVFHTLSNLPLKDPLLYGVHQRFWMQPNLLAFALAGVGFTATMRAASYACVSAVAVLTPSRSKKGKAAKQAGTVSTVSLDRVLSAFSVLLALYCTYTQYVKWAPSLDMSSDGGFFRDYATALLSPLPQNALLFVNYDQQWTSIRYMQVCEKLRPDITAIQLSMATYPWFQSKRHLYPHLDFPGKQGGAGDAGDAGGAGLGRLVLLLINIYVYIYTSAVAQPPRHTPYAICHTPYAIRHTPHRASSLTYHISHLTHCSPLLSLSLLSPLSSLSQARTTPTQAVPRKRPRAHSLSSSSWTKTRDPTSRSSWGAS